jgi:maltooligosyltrehalose trehalohydrolase
VRRFVIENALRWVTEFHVDALRLDAVHTIFDRSPRHILQELAESVHERGSELGRSMHVIAESDLNDSRLVEAVGAGGYGLDAQWSDDFHHALHSVLTRERAGYYHDFGEFQHLAKALGEGFVYSGQFSGFRGCEHGPAPYTCRAAASWSVRRTMTRSGTGRWGSDSVRCSSTSS